MATAEQLEIALRNADKAGDSFAARRLAQELAKLMQPRPSLKESNPAEYDPASPEYQAKYGPETGRLAALGMGMANVGLGLGQLVGMYDSEDIKQQRAMDAPLQQAHPIMSGLGSAAMLAPLAIVPGANSLAGAAAIGAGTGFAAPAESLAERGQNTLIGGVVGPAATVAGRGLASAWRSGKAVLEPLTKGGQERIAARTLEAFAGGPKKAKAAAATIRGTTPDILPGVKPTTAEVANNAGLAQLERSLVNNPEALTRLADVRQANRAAVIGAVDNLAGDDAAMAAARAAREAAASPLYKAAERVTVTADDDFAKLAGRPSLQRAIGRARELAAEAGDTIDDLTGDVSGKTLHFLKMAMDDLADAPPGSGISGNEARAIKGTRDALLSWIERKIPDYRQARITYQQKSLPINQMEIGQALASRLRPALTDFGANTRLRPESFAKALRDGDATAARVLGRSRASIDDILTPDQSKSLRQAAEQLARETNAAELGRAAGSNTGQNLVSQNLLRQLAGPLGLPESAVERVAGSTLAQTLLRPVQFTGKLGEARVADILADAAIDPQMAARLLEAGVPPEMIGLLRYQGLLAPSAAGAVANRPE